MFHLMTMAQFLMKRLCIWNSVQKDVGLAISAASNVTDLGKAFPGQPSVAHDSNIEGLKRLAKAMKKMVQKRLSKYIMVARNLYLI